jgi:hypothetical protein
MSSSALTRKVHRVGRHVGDLSIHAQAQAIAPGRAADRVEHGYVGRTELGAPGNPDEPALRDLVREN